VPESPNSSVTEPPRRPPFSFDAKLAFHIALAAVPLVVVFVPIVWTLALASSFFADRAEPSYRRYTRALWALAVFDLSISIALVLVVSGSGALFGEGTTNVGRMVAPSDDPPKIGVTLDQTYGGNGARIEDVLAGSPAEHASLRGGDVVIAVDGVPVDGVEAFQETIRETEEGARRELLYSRGADTHVTHVEPSTSFEPASRGLFEVVRPGPIFEPDDPETLAWNALPLALVVLLAIFVAVRSREPDRFGLRVWPALIAILILSLAVAPAAVVAGLITLRGGGSDGDMLLALNAQVLVMALLALGWKWWVERGTPSPFVGPTEIRRGRVYVLGLVYILASVARISAVVFVATALLSSDPMETGSEAIEAIVGGTSSSVLGMILVVLAVAVLGPIAEEIVFRGVLLPWLGRHMSPMLAIVTSSIVFAALHPHYGARMAAIFAIGAVLGWARWRTGDLRTSIALHMTVNGAFSLGVLAQ
jgi:membrane protease YdiL (CAAX protease family)